MPCSPRRCAHQPAAPDHRVDRIVALTEPAELHLNLASRGVLNNRVCAHHVKLHAEAPLGCAGWSPRPFRRGQCARTACSASTRTAALTSAARVIMHSTNAAEEWRAHVGTSACCDGLLHPRTCRVHRVPELVQSDDRCNTDLPRTIVRR
jgi:hypothetical protein